MGLWIQAQRGRGRRYVSAISAQLFGRAAGQSSVRTLGGESIRSPVSSPFLCPSTSYQPTVARFWPRFLSDHSPFGTIESSAPTAFIHSNDLHSRGQLPNLCFCPPSLLSRLLPTLNPSWSASLKKPSSTGQRHNPIEFDVRQQLSLSSDGRKIQLGFRRPFFAPHCSSFHNTCDRIDNERVSQRIGRQRNLFYISAYERTPCFRPSLSNKWRSSDIGSQISET